MVSDKKTTPPLACLVCRRKKIKCFPAKDGGRCRFCDNANLICTTPAVDERRLPASKGLVRSLYERIEKLEAELEGLRLQRCPAHDCDDGPAESDTVDSLISGGSSNSSAASGNMIARLCSGQRQLNSDRVGRLRFFGPTSSLHLSESVTSSVLVNDTHRPRIHFQWQQTVPHHLQDHLLELFWKYQHLSLPIIQKEAFLRDLENGQTRYCSKLLLHCIMCRAASISENRDIRALALAEDDSNDDPPLLVGQCAALLDIELNNPGITTLQSLHLLSEIYCVLSNDTKGWLDAGGACRLAFELGLHSDSNTPGTSLTRDDLEIRHIAFWGCFSLDRLWSLYLGRPQMIHEADISFREEDNTVEAVSLEKQMSIAWATLLKVVGLICDALNGARTMKHRRSSLDQKLQGWRRTLHPSFHYSREQIPSVFLLHMQFSAATILLHRPLARFGDLVPGGDNGLTQTSRATCVHHACLIAKYITEYETTHGSVFTMSWIALHIIATAATTLLGSLTDEHDSVSSSQQLSALHTCVQALAELEKSHLPTSRVRKLILHAMRSLNLDAKAATSYGRTLELGGNSPPTLEDSGLSLSHAADAQTAASDLGLCSGLENTGLDTDSFLLDEFLPAGCQMDILQSFESFINQV